jgi:hypothetical protein
MNRLPKEVREFLFLNLKKGVHIKTSEISGVVIQNYINRKDYFNRNLVSVRENKSGNTIKHLIDISEIIDIIHPKKLSQEFRSLVVLEKLQQ